MNGLKVQVMCEPRPGIEGLDWCDLANAPGFESYDKANQWLRDTGANDLVENGWSFRIMPKDHPCEFDSMGERVRVTS